MNICATRVAEYARRIAGNDVATNDIALRGRHDQNTIQVATNLVPFDYVVFACAHQPDPEIVKYRGAAWGNQSRAGVTVSAVEVQPNSVVVAAGESSSAARVALRPKRVSHGDIFFNVAVGGLKQENTAETIIGGGDALDAYLGSVF